MLPGLSLSHKDQRAHYRFYNPFTPRFIGSNEVLVVFRAMDRRFPAEYPTDWDFSEVDNEFIGRNADLVQLIASLNWWGGK